MLRLKLINVSKGGPRYPSGTTTSAGTAWKNGAIFSDLDMSKFEITDKGVGHNVFNDNDSLAFHEMDST